MALALAAFALAGCHASNDKPAKSTVDTTVTQPPVTHTVTPTDTSTVVVPPGTETHTSVVQPTQTVTAPAPTVTQTP